MARLGRAQPFRPQANKRSSQPVHTYYVSPSGSDSNTGTSSASPWQTITKVNGTTLYPGDTVLFQGGQTFSGTMLQPGQGGTTASPVTFGSYGTGQATITNSSDSAIYVYEVGGVTVENLIITGPGAVPAGAGGYVGVFFNRDLTGYAPAVTVTGCTITGWADGILAGAANAAGGYSGITFTNNQISANRDAGINVYGTGYSHQNVTITGNSAFNQTGYSGNTTTSSGHGIVVGNASGGTISQNVTYGNGASCGCTTAGPVGNWAYSSQNLVIENNVSYQNKTASPGNADGDGFDLDDQCVNCTLQYNIAYENDGFGIACYSDDSTWTGNVIRFNVTWGNSVTNPDAAELALTGGAFANCDIYGNTFIGQTNSELPSVVLLYGASFSGVNLWNNIFYTASSGVALAYSDTAYTGVTFRGNLYYSAAPFVINWGGTSYPSMAAWRTATGQEKLSGSNVGVQANPLLLAPATVPAVTSPSNLAPAQGLFLTPSSPAIGAGLNLSSLFSVSPGTTDFFGSTLTSPLPVGATGDISVPGQTAPVAAQAHAGTASSAVTMAPAAASVAALTGHANGTVPGAVANVSVVANIGTFTDTENVAGLLATVAVAAPLGHATATPPVGSVATVAASAPDGTANGTVPGAVAQVTAQALLGTVTDTEVTAGLVAAVAVAAPLGHASSTMAAGAVATVAASAPPGTPGATVNGPALGDTYGDTYGDVYGTGVLAAAQVGRAVGTVAGLVANVSAAAFTGTASAAGGSEVSGLVANVNVAALAGTATASVNTTGSVAAVAVAAPLGTPGTSLTGLVAAVTAQAYAGTAIASEDITGSTAAVSVAARTGTPGAGITAPPAAVSAQAYVGHASGTVPGAAARVTVAAPTGMASNATIVAGHAAAVTAVAHFGAVIVSPNVTGLAAAVTAQAHVGVPGAGIPGFTTHVAAQVYPGTAASSLTGLAASVSAAAHVGHAGVSVVGLVALNSPAAHPGTASSKVAGQAARVSATALPGSVGTSLTGLTASVSSLALLGTLGVKTPGTTARVMLACPLGMTAVSTPGHVAQVFMAAPVSPLVAMTYQVTSRATIKFRAGGVHEDQRVWLGPGLVTYLNVEYQPPGTT